jgi:hypothetical protein
MRRRSAESWGGFRLLLSLLLTFGGLFFVTLFCWARVETGDTSKTDLLPIPLVITVSGIVLFLFSYRVK